MNILYHFRTQGTGAEGVHISGIATAFERLGHRVVFSSPTGVDPRTTAGANPFAEKKRRSLIARLATHAPGFVFELLELAYNAVAYARNRAALTRENCTLIYERHAFFLCATAFLAQRRGVPLVVEVNELAGDERVRAAPWLLPLARLADRLTFQRARLIVVVSPHLQRRIAALGIAPEKIVVLPNAVSVESLDIPADGAPVRARHGCADAIIIGFVGWFVAWHRLDQLLAQFASLARAEPRLRLMLVGDGTLRATLAAQATDLGLADRVLFTGALPHAEIPAHFAAMDISVVPHSNEYRSPIKLFESMARARATVAPRTEPIAQIITDGVNGLLFDPADPATLRHALQRLIADPALRTRLGTAARVTIRERHTWDRNAQAVLDAIRLT
ncbi:MAG: glycosyltransferase family 4 protein [Chthoniobacter sp.]|nr:glycosyltransferase family 4 protein [Chthoniobacter sp.]